MGPAVAYEVRRGEPVLRPLLDQLGTLGGLPRTCDIEASCDTRAWSEQEQTVDLKMYIAGPLDAIRKSYRSPTSLLTQSRAWSSISAVDLRGRRRRSTRSRTQILASCRFSGRQCSV